ncbi:hypothetical protein BRADI_1g57085v3 [Brachypodium distachyon]|uniref:Uncharacterized protein n=1 Tax=Brachypodium distachyon TaxID=15368 RepID=A0A2K2DRZ0_BRADI|nr:hypothetical protein BRADI_1g57085v3 [Brachypodium distachyon]
MSSYSYRLQYKRKIGPSLFEELCPTASDSSKNHEGLQGTAWCILDSRMALP